MNKAIFLIFFIIIFLIFMGCTEQLNFNDSDDNSNGGSNSNGIKHSGNDAQIRQIIANLVALEEQYDYTYYVQTHHCKETGECDPPANTTFKISNKLNYTLSIFHREDYNSYYLYDYNDMVARQWAPGRLVYGSEVECSGFSITKSKTLNDLNVTIIDNNKFLYVDDYVDCTHIIYYTYNSYEPEEVNMIYEQWIWDDYGVKLKTHIYRPPEDPHLPDFDSTSYMTKYVFEDLTSLDFAWPDPCTIFD